MSGKDSEARNILIITAVYFLAHWMLLAMSGCWWDDWCMIGQDMDTIVNLVRDIGRPSLIPINMLLLALPQGGYRIIVFILFYLTAILFYKILRRGFDLSGETCLYVCLLSVCLPHNDARVLAAVFAYTIGVFLFALSYYLLVLFFEHGQNILLRLLVLAGFFLSFSLNSNMVMYGLALVFIIYKNGSIKSLTKYADFILLPFLFFGIKTIFFTPYGAYTGYNSVTIRGLIYGAATILFCDVWVTANILFTALAETLSAKYFIITILTIAILVALTASTLWNYYRHRDSLSDNTPPPVSIF